MRAFLALVLALPAYALAGGAPAPAPATPQKDAPAADKRAALAGHGPLDFRCDGMQVLAKPNRTLCRGNVIIRRSDILVCCDNFEGEADDNWQWQRLVCFDNVRAQRHDETIWAQHAEFVPQSSDLVLTGRPVVKRGESVLEGERVIVNTNDEHARIEKPRGQLLSLDMKQKAPPAVDPSAPLPPLPKKCPLAPLERPRPK